VVILAEAPAPDAGVAAPIARVETAEIAPPVAPGPPAAPELVQTPAPAAPAVPAPPEVPAASVAVVVAPVTAPAPAPEAAVAPAVKAPPIPVEVPPPAADPAHEVPAGTVVGKAASPTVPAAAGTPPEAAGPEWIVNVMTLTDPELAKQHQAVLAKAGYPATLRTETVRGRSSYRIVIGGIGSEQGARRTAQLLASKMGYTGAWPLQKR